MKLFLAPTAFLATSVISQKILKGRGWKNVDLTNPRFSDGKYYNDGDWILPPSLALDGEMYGGENWRVQNFYGPHNIQNIFAHSSSGKDPQFIVDVNSNAGARISEVVIHPRQDCCWDRYSGMEVFVVSLYGNENFKCKARSSLDADSVRRKRVTSWKNRDSGGLWWECPDFNVKSIYDVKSILVKNSDWIQIAEIEASGEMLNGYVMDNYVTNRDYDFVPIDLRNAKSEIDSTLTLEIEVKANNDATILFCGDQEINPAFNPTQANNLCMELVIGGWLGGKSLFRSSPQNDENPIHPFIVHSDYRPLNQKAYRNFKIVFDADGNLSIYRVSSSDYQKSLDARERYVSGKLVDNSVKIVYDEDPWMFRENWSAISLISEIKQVGIATGWGSDGHWNVLFDHY